MGLVFFRCIFKCMTDLQGIPSCVSRIQTNTIFHSLPPLEQYHQDEKQRAGIIHFGYAPSPYRKSPFYSEPADGQHNLICNNHHQRQRQKQSTTHSASATLLGTHTHTLLVPFSFRFFETEIWWDCAAQSRSTVHACAQAKAPLRHRKKERKEGRKRGRGRRAFP